MKIDSILIDFMAIQCHSPFENLFCRHGVSLALLLALVSRGKVWQAKVPMFEAPHLSRGIVHSRVTQGSFTLSSLGPCLKVSLHTYVPKHFSYADTWLFLFNHKCISTLRIYQLTSAVIAFHNNQSSQCLLVVNQL